MSKTNSIDIQPRDFVNGDVLIPGSKSYTNRAIAIAALAEGQTVIEHALVSEDTEFIAKGVESFGNVHIDIDAEKERMLVNRKPAAPVAPKQPIFFGNAGTPIRFAITMASLANGVCELTGNERMQHRPCQDLIDALVQLGVKAHVIRGTGCPPIQVEGPSLRGGKAKIRGSVSSQYTSSILISAPYAEMDVELEITDDLTSKPYVDMTVGIMKDFGVEVERDGYRRFKVRAGQRYRAGTYRVEPDASNMSYFLAAAAITRGRVCIPGINISSLQGDVKFIDVLEQMGCCVEKETDYIAVSGKQMRGIDADMNRMPDIVPTLAVMAAFAEGRTHIYNIGNLRIKECDRIAAVENELRKMGIDTESTEDTLTVYGGKPTGAVIDTYDDHRIAMAFAIAGLKTPGVVINNPSCTAKSFPTFWEIFNGLS
ncbi:MAG: 3-phosphoshikimate 1-carboxyvinyltransferase [Bacillota bacterium]